MARNFKEARLRRNLKLTEVASKLEVAQSTVSSWEAERLFPSPENLIKLSKIYRVSIDYLLGNSPYFDYDVSKPIPVESYPIYHSKPVWSNTYQWVLINSQKQAVILPTGEEISFDKAGKLFIVPSAFAEPDLPLKNPIDISDLQNHEEVWLESISADITQREMIRGRYIVKNGFVEDRRGIRFFFSTYGASWLAFESDK